MLASFSIACYATVHAAVSSGAYPPPPPRSIILENLGTALFVMTVAACLVAFVLLYAPVSDHPSHQANQQTIREEASSPLQAPLFFPEDQQLAQAP